MAESTLSVSYNDLMASVGAFLGYGSSSTDWTVAQIAEIDRYVQAGVRRVYFPEAAEGVEPGYSWSFLKPTTTLVTVIDDGAQDLPDDFGRLVGQLSFAPEVYYPPVVLVSEGKMLELLQMNESSSRPRYASVRFKALADGATAGQRQEILWWPIPDAVYTLYYQYESFTGKLSATNLYPLGGMRHSELYTESCLAVAEQLANDERGNHSQQFVKMLISGITQDRKNGARYFGLMGGGEDEVVARHQPASSYPITYKGVTW